ARTRRRRARCSSFNVMDRSQARSWHHRSASTFEGATESVTRVRVAIVDDDPMFVEYLANFLKSRGYDVTTYVSGSELLASLTKAPPPGVILLGVVHARMYR